MDKKKYKKTKYPNIYKHIENGTYAVDLSLGYDYSGKRIRTTRTGLKTEKEAKDLIKNSEKQAKIKQGIEFNYMSMDLIEEYFDWCLYSDKQKKSTVINKRGRFNKHIIPFFENIELNNIDGNDNIIEDWHKYLMEKEDICDETRNTLHKRLSAYLNWLQKKKKVIKVNPCTLVKNFALPYHEILYYDDKQIKQLRKTMKNYKKNKLVAYRTLAITDTIYGMGLRLGELQGFWPSDFDFDLLNSTVCNEKVVKVHLNRTIVDDKEISDGKTKGSLDVLYVGANTINSILNYINYCKSIGIVFKENDFIFKNPDRNWPYAQQTIRTNINFFIDKAGLPRRKVKELRNSTASYLISNGCGLKEVQEQLRHASSNTTSKHYATLFVENKIKRAEMMDNAL